MLSVSSGTSAYQYQKMFSQLDTNQDGTVSQEEFAAGRPKNVTEAQSSTLYASLNSSGSGALSYDEYVSGSQGVSDAAAVKSSGEIMALLLDMWQQLERSEKPEKPSSADMFAKLDTDDDGTVTQAEFLAGRPDDISEEQATRLFASIDTEDAGSVTEEQFSAGMEAQAPGGPPRGMMPPLDPASSDSVAANDETTATDAETEIKDLLNQLLLAIQSYQDNEADKADATTNLPLAA